MGEGARTVFLVEDDRALGQATAQTLDLAGFQVALFERVTGVAEKVAAQSPAVVVSDVRLADGDGLALHQAIKAVDPDLPVILVTGHGDIAMAVRAIRDGAYDFLEKPVEPEKLIAQVSRALEKRRLILENRALQMQLAAGPLGGLVGRSPAMVQLRRLIVELAAVRADVLLVGETGTGKEVVARALHALGLAPQAAFVALNCGAMPETMIESELFGHERGAFTGADKRRVGRIEFAHGGTLFLDEIESMPLHVQVKLLRVLQERAVEPLGTNRIVPVDLRVIAAAKVDLLAMAEAGDFRKDLYYRLNVVTVNIPPLRERPEDILPLFQHFTIMASMRYRRTVGMPDEGLMERLLAHDWPGNVREVKNWAERFVLGLDPIAPMAPKRGLADLVAFYERSVIETALAAHGGDVNRVLEQLDLPRKTFYDKLKRHGLSRRDFEA